MKIICSWCKKIMGEKEPFDDASETHGKCSECLEKERRELDVAKKKAAPINIKAILKKEVIILGIVSLVAFLNRNSAPASTFSSFSSSSKTSPYGTMDSSSFSMNYQFSFFWMLIYGYLIYLFFRVIFIGVRLIRKSKEN